MTHTIHTRFALAALAALSLAASVNWAQPAQAPQAAPSAPPAQAAPQQVARDLNALRTGAFQVVAMVDAGRLAGLWDNASPVARRELCTAQFVAAMQARLGLGPALSRRWVQTLEERSAPAGTAPPGLNVSVEFLSNFAGHQDVREVVHLRFDEDKTWRLSGYASGR